MKKIAIAGAGTMGFSMSEIFAEYCHEVLLYDISDVALKDAEDNISFYLETALSEQRLTADKANEVRSRITFSNSMNDFSDADIVVECIVENLEIKRKFFRELSSLVDKTAILATNTSGISIDAISESVEAPDRFIGMHWFNPPRLIPLIEIIRGEKTSDATTEAIHKLSLSIDKKPVVVNKDVPGFVANRLQMAIIRESLHLVEQGVISAEGIDSIVKYGLGIRYACSGPLEVVDFGGIDIFYHISEYLTEDLCCDKSTSALLKEKYQTGELGLKTKRGFYDYADGKDEVAVKERNRKLAAIYDLLYETTDT